MMNSQKLHASTLAVLSRNLFQLWKLCETVCHIFSTVWCRHSVPKIGQKRLQKTAHHENSAHCPCRSKITHVLTSGAKARGVAPLLGESSADKSNVSLDICGGILNQCQPKNTNLLQNTNLSKQSLLQTTVNSVWLSSSCLQHEYQVQCNPRQDVG